MSFYKNKKFWIIAGIAAIACIAGTVAVKNVKVQKNTVSVIGGADGPTAIFLAGKLPGKDSQTQEDAQTQEKTQMEEEPQTQTEENISTLPLEMTMKAVKFENGILTLEIDNHSGYEMTYGDDYELQKKEGDSFVRVEPKEDIAWKDAAYSIPDLEKVTVTCDLRPYGKLQAGVYKLIKSEMEAAFELTEDYDPE